MERDTRVYTLLGIVTCLLVFYVNFRGDVIAYLPFSLPSMNFVKCNGRNFVVDGKPLYVNGWNSYWMMDQSVEVNNRHKVKTIFKKGGEMGLNVVRTWAFNDGGYNALQVEPGVLDERVFQALDFVVVEARKNGIRLILSLVNNLMPFGGKVQYVKWANAAGVDAGNLNDTFFSHPTIRGYYKNFVKAVLTRKNTISGVEYRNEPAIFAWELMNEPRCMSDPSGHTLKYWISEMGEYVKSLDKKHLVTVGIEGFYRHTHFNKTDINPGDWADVLGTDFIEDSQIQYIDFASIHAYPDNWLPHLELEDRLKFISRWVASHIKDADEILKKPLLITEFGLNSSRSGFNFTHREMLLKIMFDNVYESAKRSGSGSGALVWQYLVDDMDEYGDEFAFAPWDLPSTYSLILEQSCRLKALNDKGHNNDRKTYNICPKSKHR